MRLQPGVFSSGLSLQGLGLVLLQLRALTWSFTRVNRIMAVIWRSGIMMEILEMGWFGDDEDDGDDE